MKLKNIMLIGLFAAFILTFITGCSGIGGGGGTEYTLIIACEGSGRVADESGYAIVTRRYASGSVVNLVPVGDTAAWAFKNWAGPNGGEVGNNQITMNGEKNITAVFSPLTHNVTIEVSGQGAVSRELVMGGLSLPTYKGDKIRLNPVPALGWYFDHWEGDLTSYELQPELVVDSDKTITAVFKQPIAYTDFSESAENKTSFLLPQGTWEKTSAVAHSGSYSWTDSPNGNYSENPFDISLRSCAVNMNGSQHPYLAFWHRYNTSAYCSVEVSKDAGVTWAVLADFYGTKDWSRMVVYLEDYKSDIIVVRFRIKKTSSYGSVSDGWYIDDVCIKDQPVIHYTAFNEGAESETDLVCPAGEWGKTTESSHSGSHSWTDSPGADYKSYVDYSLITCIIDMNGSESPYLEFWHRYNIGSSAYCYVEISNNYGETWSQVKAYYGRGNIDWQSQVIDLGAYKTARIQIRFRIYAYYYTSDGWYIDDIRIKESSLFSNYFDDAESGSSFMVSDKNHYILP